MFAQVGVRAGQILQRLTDRASGHLNRVLLVSVLTKRSRNQHSHSCFQSPCTKNLYAAEPPPISGCGTAASALAAATPFSSATATRRISSGSKCLSSSRVPCNSKEFVAAALPFSTLVITYEHPIQCASARSVVDHIAG